MTNPILKPVVLAATLAAGSASASTVSLDYQTSGNAFGSENLQQIVRVASPGYNGRARAGAFQMTGDNGYGNIIAFCVDIFQYLRDGQTYVENDQLFDATIVQNIDRLFTSVYRSVDTAVEAAAFQVSLWEVIYDQEGSYDLDAGSFSTSGNSAVEAVADGYLAGLANASTGGYDITFLENGSTQDVVTVAAVPLPASFLLMLGGFAGFAAVKRKQRGQTA
jgi:hypothetical protein